MGYNRIQAEALLNDREYELFAASLDDAIGDLDAAGVRAAIKRIRTARDKAKDLQARQARASGARAGGRGRALGTNERTAAKAAVLGEALTRYERRAARLEREAARAERAQRLAAAERRGRKVAAQPPGAGNRSDRRAAARGTKGRAGFQSSSAVASDVQRLDSPHAKNLSASRAAAGRRGQARRDAKG